MEVRLQMRTGQGKRPGQQASGKSLSAYQKEQP